MGRGLVKYENPSGVMDQQLGGSFVAGLHSGERTCQRGQTKCHYDFPDRAAISLWHVLAESYLTRGDFSVLVLQLRVEKHLWGPWCVVHRQLVKKTLLNAMEYDRPHFGTIQWFRWLNSRSLRILLVRNEEAHLCFVAPCFRLSSRVVSVWVQFRSCSKCCPRNRIPSRIPL